MSSNDSRLLLTFQFYVVTADVMGNMYFMTAT